MDRAVYSAPIPVCIFLQLWPTGNVRNQESLLTEHYIIHV